MSTIAPPLNGEELLQRVRDEGRVFLTGVSWKEYRRLMDSIGEGSCCHAYDHGNLELTSRSHPLGSLRTLLDRLIVIWADENEIPMSFWGNSALQREDIERAVRGDRMYWVHNLERLHDPVELDLQRDPPPDLVVELEMSTSVIDKLSIYAALGVPEIWRLSAAGIRVGCLQPEGIYPWGDQSGIFPTLSLTEIFRFVQETSRNHNHLIGLRAFRTWVRQRLGK